MGNILVGTGWKTKSRRAGCCAWRWKGCFENPAGLKGTFWIISLSNDKNWISVYSVNKKTKHKFRHKPMRAWKWIVTLFQTLGKFMSDWWGDARKREPTDEHWGHVLNWGNPIWIWCASTGKTRTVSILYIIIMCIYIHITYLNRHFFNIHIGWTVKNPWCCDQVLLNHRAGLPGALSETVSLLPWPGNFRWPSHAGFHGGNQHSMMESWSLCTSWCLLCS